MHTFNDCKSNANHENLVSKKSAYKKLAFKLKRQYERHEGDMMEFLRKEFTNIFVSVSQRQLKQILLQINF